MWVLKLRPKEAKEPLSKVPDYAQENRDSSPALSFWNSQSSFPFLHDNVKSAQKRGISENSVLLTPLDTDVMIWL